MTGGTGLAGGIATSSRGLECRALHLSVTWSAVALDRGGHGRPVPSAESRGQLWWSAVTRDHETAARVTASLVVGGTGEHLPETPASAARVRGRRVAPTDHVPEGDDQTVCEGFDRVVAEKAGGENQEPQDVGVAGCGAGLKAERGSLTHHRGEDLYSLCSLHQRALLDYQLSPIPIPIPP